MLHGKPYKTSRGYLFAWNPAAKRPMGLHRILWEHHYGVKLKPDQHIHHRNGKRDDNRLENLELVSPDRHRELHGQTPLVPVTCPVCGSTRIQRKQSLRRYKTLRCRTCKDRTNAVQISYAHITWYWVVWECETILGPFQNRDKARANMPNVPFKAKSLCSFNNRLGKVFTQRQGLPERIKARIARIAKENANGL